MWLNAFDLNVSLNSLRNPTAIRRLVWLYKSNIIHLSSSTPIVNGLVWGGKKNK